MGAHELGTFGGSLFRVLHKVLPLHHRPAVVIVLRQLGEHRAKVYLPVARGAEAARPVGPRFVAAVHARLGGGVKLGILHVEHFDELVIQVDVRQIIELLQNVVAGVVEHIDALVVAGGLQKTLEGGPVVQVFTRMNFVAHVHSLLVEGVEDGCPAIGQFFEGHLYQTGGALGPGVHEGPGERSRKGGVHIHPEVATGLGGQHHLVDGPLGAGLGVVVHFGRSERIEHRIVGRMHRHQLPLQVRRKFGDFYSGFLGHALEFVAVVFAVGSFL